MSHAEPAFPVIAEAARQARAPWAASVAGLLFAALFTAGMVLIRSQPFIGATQEELDRLFAEGGDLAGIIGGLYLLPFAGVMFLWFIAVIRDQIGEREDRFFATVFFGSGLLFVAILFAATAVASAPLVGSRYLGQGPPSVAEFESARALAYTLFFAFGTRAAAVFLISMATIGLRSGVLPVWFGRAGYVVGLAAPLRRFLLRLDRRDPAGLGCADQPLHPAPRALEAPAERVLA